ncbi:MAG: tetratricopeptide repeat protein [Lactobacillus sp.]|uniref:tetratricopeptide repeat protein n=1 Tax=Bombilactobacillus bombi TaxID=1303590 RepID=UPI0035E6C18C|nr:tetratricopeptide repeat protein [Lactobacillus sp.]
MSFSEKALTAYSSGDVLQAQDFVHQALKQDNDDELFSLAENLTAIGITDAAKTIYKQLLQKYPNEDILKIDLAEILISDNKIDQATDLLEQVSPESSDYLSALLVSADLYQTIGLYEVSEQKLQTALKLAPTEPVIQFALAELYFVENKFAQAEVFYEKLINQGQKNFSGISLIQRLASAYAGEGKYEQAAQEYQLVPLETMTADNQANYATVEIELKNFSTAQKILDNLLTTTPDYSAGYNLVVKVAIQQQDYQLAVKQAQIGLGYDPFNQELYQLGSQAALKTGNFQQAKDLLIQGIEQVADNSKLIISLSNLYLQIEDHQANLDLLNKYHQELADQPRFYWNLARSENALEQFDQALKDMLNVYQQYQDNAFYLKDLINILRQKSQPQLLQAATKRYLQLVPNDEEINELEQELSDLDDN